MLAQVFKVIGACPMGQVATRQFRDARGVVKTCLVKQVIPPPIYMLTQAFKVTQACPIVPVATRQFRDARRVVKTCLVNS